MDYDEIKQEIQVDPDRKGYAGKSHAQIAAILNTKTETQLRPIPIEKLLRYGGTSGLLQRLKAGTENNPSDLIKSMCWVFLWMLNNPNLVEFDIEENDNLVNSLVTEGVIKPGEYTALTTMATHMVSKAEKMGRGNLSHQDVAKALRS